MTHEEYDAVWSMKPIKAWTAEDCQGLLEYWSVTASSGIREKYARLAELGQSRMTSVVNFVLPGKDPAWPRQRERSPDVMGLPCVEWTRHDGALLLRSWARSFTEGGLTHAKYNRLAQHLEDTFTVEVSDDNP